MTEAMQPRMVAPSGVLSECRRGDVRDRGCEEKAPRPRRLVRRVACPHEVLQKNPFWTLVGDEHHLDAIGDELMFGVVDDIAECSGRRKEQKITVLAPGSASGRRVCHAGARLRVVVGLFGLRLRTGPRSSSAVASASRRSSKT